MSAVIQRERMEPCHRADRIPRGGHPSRGAPSSPTARAHGGDVVYVGL